MSGSAGRRGAATVAEREARAALCSALRGGWAGRGGRWVLMWAAGFLLGGRSLSRMGGAVTMP